MIHYQILNIQEILDKKEGVSYLGEIAVFVSDNIQEFTLSGGLPIYVNAFSYILILKGSATLFIDENQHSVNADTLCMLSPLHLTCFSNRSEDFKCIFLCMHKDFIDKIGVFNLKQRIAKGINLHSNPLLKITPQDTEILKTNIKHIKEQILRKEHLYHLELIQNALIKFYLELDNIFDRKEMPGRNATDIPRDSIKLQEFMTLLMTHFKEEHQVAFYAQAMNITPQYLTAIIKRQTGKTVNSFIYELIYSEARNLLLSTDLSIQQITTRLNFADQASFSKFFKRHSGVSPQLYRTNRYPTKENPSNDKQNGQGSGTY